MKTNSPPPVSVFESSSASLGLKPPVVVMAMTPEMAASVLFAMQCGSSHLAPMIDSEVSQARALLVRILKDHRFPAAAELEQMERQVIAAAKERRGCAN